MPYLNAYERYTKARVRYKVAYGRYTATEVPLVGSDYTDRAATQRLCAVKYRGREVRGNAVVYRRTGDRLLERLRPSQSSGRVVKALAEGALTLIQNSDRKAKKAYPEPPSSALVAYAQWKFRVVGFQASYRITGQRVYRTG